ncbi:MAG TPA: glycosyltransferase family 2 protein [Patescibacteria group bacterium]|nr:glycosyltransferase family 2 protein [Patescibacteria group bacterium]
MLFPLLTVFDFSTVRANFIRPINLKKIQARSNDFALLVPIFNDTKYLTNVEFLRLYSDRVVLCTTTNETPEFMNDLQNLSNRFGFRIYRCDVGIGKKNPWAIYNKTLLAHDAVLKSTIGQLNEKYVIFIDGDTFVDGSLSLLCGAMDENNFDLASVKVLPSKRNTVMEHLQGVEYDIAMQARLIYPWLTSGAGMVAKRSVMISIMRNHSLFFNGGDVEIGRLADMMGYNIGHIPMPFYTDVPSTFTGWVKQRFSWMCGMFRHSIINIDHNLRHPFHFIYYTFIIYFLIPFKLFELLTKPHLIPLIMAVYFLITFIANWKVKSRWMLLFPFYALFQIIIIIWFGIYRYLTTVIKSRNVGKIRMQYNPNSVSALDYSHLTKSLKNYATISLAVFVICATNVSFFQRIVFGKDYEVIELAQAISLNLTKNVEKIGTNIAMDTEGWGDPAVIPQVAGASAESNEQTIEE